MHTNRAFWRAINSFIHPLSMAAVVLLLFNDHWLRLYHPSWLTGKLGDFTWLIFAPFIAAACFAWLIPRRLKHHERVVGVAAFAFIGLWFALAKTFTPVHELTVNAWEAIIGWQGTQRMDATDLLTLPALLIGWWIFWRADNRPLSFRPIAPVLFALSIMATLASDYPMGRYSDSGITQICQMGSLLATITEARPRSEYIGSNDPQQNSDPDDPKNWEITRFENVFTSNDGGFTWQHSVREKETVPTGICSEARSNIVVNPQNELIQYRWQPGEHIERSIDGGQSWALDYNLIEMQQDVRRYYNHKSFSGFEYDRAFFVGPSSGLVDTVSGNLVLAMSWDGVLVRTPEGKWQWVAVGDDYQLEEISGFSKLTSILFFELWLAGALGFLIVTSSTAYMRRRWIHIRVWFLAFAWFAWVTLTIFALPSSKGTNGEWLMIGFLGIPLLVFLAIPLSVGAVWDIARNFRKVCRPIALVALGVALLYILPFVLWSQGTIPQYTTALIFSLLLSGAGLFAGGLFLKKQLPLFYKSRDAQWDAEK